MEKMIVDKILRESASRLGPWRMTELMRQVADEDSNNFEIAREFELSLYAVKILRMCPQFCLLYVLGHLRVPIAKERAQILPFAESRRA
jgi:hypothetical protein